MIKIVSQSSSSIKLLRQPQTCSLFDSVFVCFISEFQESLLPDDSSEGPPVSSHISANTASTSTSKASRKKGSAPTDFELMSLMMRRVTALEKTVRRQAQEIESRDKKISALQRKLKIQNQSGTELAEDDLHRRNQQLQNQLFEMENFLSDYGLIWVGDAEKEGSSEDEQILDPPQRGNGSFLVNFDLVVQSIRELNILAGEGESFVRTTAGRAQLAQKEPIQLSLYSNGILMFDGPFRSYRDLSTQQCVTDLMDGYFPSELQDRFPDGAPFEVHDRRDEEFIPTLPMEQFPGEGQAVRGEKPQSASTVSYKLPGLWLNSRADQFLDKLPKVVVKRGRVIKIREPIRAMLQGVSDVQSSGSSSVVLLQTPALQEVTARYHQSPLNDIITLKVRSEDGDQVYIVKMRLSETVGHLRKYLDQHRGRGFPPAYDIISAHPQRRYDDAHTLQSYGLTTNTTLLLQKKQAAVH
ncbi:UBX domain-containing protein 11 [Salarias fasciatus]|uniref:UBX domain-containing protein 11 n=1 Tax=Salarias fasciatus TaxID=181472 RepID=UPI001176C9F1|nr:UBX domain-containing protein 11 [Salarias fasciatus]